MSLFKPRVSKKKWIVVVGLDSTKYMNREINVTARDERTAALLAQYAYHNMVDVRSWQVVEIKFVKPINDNVAVEV